ncbi:uncharacterized protein ARMOST_20067 [Armillaria ostoyae]|uniref:Uncharacterized protein n=1 Tax=Armillaria ostoyae TaxID=47428 RepID=A0A284S6C1_ARMOS|nr:uncharacterized protein ARMOST_20067 [Armillaria ostoyae]
MVNPCWEYFTKTDIPYTIPPGHQHCSKKPLVAWNTFCNLCQPDCAFLIFCLGGKFANISRHTETGVAFNSTSVKTLWHHLTQCSGASYEVKTLAENFANGDALHQLRTDEEWLEEGWKMFQGKISCLSNDCRYIMVNAVHMGSWFSLGEITCTQHLISLFAAANHAQSLQINAACLCLHQELNGSNVTGFTWEDHLATEHLAAVQGSHKSMSKHLFHSPAPLLNIAPAF